MLEVDSVVKTYGTLRAVDGLSFAARPAEIFGLIGPNGAGKSTTIRMIMNIIAPDSGTILFDGRPMDAGGKEKIGYLPEERGLYRKGRVLDTLVYLARLKGMPEKASRASALSWLERFDLSDWKDRKIEELSKGMAQKVQFIGTILHDPKLVFFDEPFSGLDPVNQEKLFDILEELKGRGTTVLLSTHIMEQAEKACDRLLLIDRGKAVVAGTVSEVKAAYGKNSVQIEFEGDASFVRELGFVAKATERTRWMEIELRPEASPSQLFSALAGRLDVRRFEVEAPSLHRIFLSLAGGEGHDA
jgi:ABC-2 type transport system ATP-binding protein